jgi:periplasmic copper chaperone A
MKGYLLAILAAASLVVQAQPSPSIDVSSAWARPTVEGQLGTGAFMRLLSKDGARVVGASSEVAGIVEIHEMVIQGNVMRMRAIDGLDLPPGEPVELKPGGHHLMLLDLKRALRNGEKIRVDLRVETRDRKPLTQPIEIEVRPRAP